MALDIKSIAELSGLSFSIPAYQRGYRWEKKQIKQLLNDLKEFADTLEKAIMDDELEEDSSKRTHVTNVGFYCLQPLAVMPIKNEQGEVIQYEVIDGQQRLTTIFLILSWLNHSGIENPYDTSKSLDSLRFFIKYDRREEAFFKDELFKTNDQNARENIDYYFMAKAYETIESWFNNNPQSQKAILNLFFPKNYHQITQKFDRDRAQKLLHDVRFVWYEVKESESSIPTFNDLNYGKISLTSAELIKALLMQNTHHSDSGVSSNIQKSLEWSAMEEALQDEYFWAMLNPSQEPCDLHMEFLLDFIADEVYKENPKLFEDKDWSEDDKDWSFLVVNEYIAEKNSASRIEEIWRRIKHVFNTFNNWYQNREIYHKVGLIMLYIQRKHKNKKKEVIAESRAMLSDLYASYKTSLRDEFMNILNSQVGKKSAIVNCTSEMANGQVVSRAKRLDEICYNEDDEDIRKVLLLYCVEQSLMQTQDSERFPFHLIEKYQVYSLEHIHAQHLNDSDASFKDLSEWYKNKKGVLDEHRNNSHVKHSERRLKSAYAFLDDIFNKSEKDYNQCKDQCREHLQVIDEIYDKISEMDANAHMHTLYNMALVDKNVNAALSNNLLDKKRFILKTHVCKTPATTYVPLGTWHAFNKHFSDKISNMKFWTVEDRTKYFAEIERVYNKYHK